VPHSAPAGTPPKQLRGFEKVVLKSGGSSEVTFTLMRRDLSYWDVVKQEWIIAAGEFGFGSRDFKLVQKQNVL
jgi:beta-glucosidase